MREQNPAMLWACCRPSHFGDWPHRTAGPEQSENTSEDIKSCMLQCLVYACHVEPDILEPGVAALVKLLQNMARDFHGKPIPLPMLPP